jgi:glycosyltransferase involved in cell wall biosynthesis
MLPDRIADAGSAPLRVGIDASALVSRKQPTGVQRYLAELVSHLGTHCEAADIQLCLYSAHPLPDEAGPVHALSSVSPRRIRWRIAPTIRGWRRIGMGLAMRVDRLDVFHFPSPLTCGYCPVPMVVTLHDLAQLSAGDEASESARAYLRQAREVARRASGLIAVSDSTSRELARHLGRSDAMVIPEGVADRFRPVPVAEADAARGRYHLDRYVFCVGTQHVLKNHLRLIQAFEKIQHRVPQSLVIAGGEGSGSAAIRAHLAERPNPRIRCIGYVEHAALPPLYGGADAFAFPSLWEGFGLPLLEAMACGTPALTSDVSALAEIGADAALLVDPMDVAQIADGLHRLLTDATLAGRLSEAGLARARRFSWDATARQTAAFYRAVHERAGTRDVVSPAPL